MRRRDFIRVIGGAAAMWPLASGAQQAAQMRRIGIFNTLAADDPEMKKRLAAFRQELGRLGWSEGHNIQIETRFAEGKPDRYSHLTKELVKLRPDVLVVQTTPATAAMQAETSAIPIVFTQVSDPIGSGFVANLARPGGNVTGVLLYEEGITGKWLAMLREIAPHLRRVAVVGNRKSTPFDYFRHAAETTAPSLAIDIVPTPISTVADIQQNIEAFAPVPNGGLLFLPDATSFSNREFVVALAAKYSLPAIYPFREFVEVGGLMSYGTDLNEAMRLCASYVDRILRGAKPAELPVQAPTKYETVVNLKTAKGLGLNVPESLLVRADEAIE
jgi:ABC-type uncharacterized transport system substrate-binding protein